MNSESERDILEVNDDLLANLETLEWSVRKSLIASLRDHMLDGEPREELVCLIQRCADDPKWEVRKEVAKLIPYLTANRFCNVIEDLLNDSNSFVRKTAEQGRDRQQAVQAERQRRQRDLDEVAILFAKMEKRYGTAAAQMARRISDRLYDLLVGATVHNMRGILTSLKGDSATLESLLPEWVSDRTALRSIRRVVASIATLERLAHELRTYCRPVPFQRRRERLLDLVNAACQLARKDFEERGFCCDGIQIALTIPESITLDAAWHQFVVALANLLNNAFDAFIARSTSSIQDRITIVGSLNGSGEIELTIADNGVGFGAEELAQIRQFIPGQTTLKQHGTGFGLPTANRYIAAHGGTLQIDSVPDVGTTVLITLPSHFQEELA